jgi:hypothetical protein
MSLGMRADDDDDDDDHDDDDDITLRYTPSQILVRVKLV